MTAIDFQGTPETQTKTTHRISVKNGWRVPKKIDFRFSRATETGLLLRPKRKFYYLLLAGMTHRPGERPTAGFIGAHLPTRIA